MRFALSAVAMASVSIVCACTVEQDGPEREELVFFSDESLCPELDAPCVNAQTDQFEVAGIRVIHRTISGHPLVAAKVLFDRGTAWLSAKAALAEAIAMSILTSAGSASLYMSDFRDLLAELGADIWGGSLPDYAHISLLTPRFNLDRSWALLEDAMFDPELSEYYLEHAQAHIGWSWDTQGDEAPGAVSLAAWLLLYERHPYSLATTATDVIYDITPRDLQRALDDLLHKELITVVIVGDVDRKTVKEMVEMSFGHLPESSGRSSENPPQPEGSDARVTISYDNTAAASHIAGIFPAIAPSHPDYPALVLALSILESRLYESVRIERGLAYGLRIFAFFLRANAGMLQVSTDEPAEALTVIRETIEQMIDEGISPADIEAHKSLYRTQFYANIPTIQELAHTLAAWHLMTGDRLRADTHLQNLRDVSAEDLRRVLQDHLFDIRYAARGPEGKVSEEILTLGMP